MMSALGIRVLRQSEKAVELVRQTNESVIRVRLTEGRGGSEVKTPLKYFNRMVASIASQAGLSLRLEYEARNRRIESTHVITEDSGIVLGHALRLLLDARRPRGVRQRGSNVERKIPISKAKVLAAVSVEGRGSLQLIAPSARLAVHKMAAWDVEDTTPARLKELMDGIAFGLGARIEVTPLTGADPHHIWESVFRGIGCALRRARRKDDGCARVRYGRASALAESGPRRPYGLDAGGHFMNHMLEHIGWNAGVNLDVSAPKLRPRDVGVAVGFALYAAGFDGEGEDLGVIDEAVSAVTIRRAGRGSAVLKKSGGGADVLKMLAGKSGDTRRVDLDDFYCALSQNMGAAVNILPMKKAAGWDDIACAFGTALAWTFESNPYLAGTTTGVKGTME